MANSDLGTCAKITKVLLIIINILFTILGIILLAIGIWAVVQNQSYSFVTDSSVISGGALLIVCGILTIAVNLISIVGALFQLRPLLLVFAVIVLVVFILELAAAILTFVFAGVVETEVEKSVLEAIRDYRASMDDADYQRDVNDAVDAFQNGFDCCGYNNATDWIRENPNLVRSNLGPPASCARCNVTDTNSEECMSYTLFGNNTVPDVTFSTTPTGCRDTSNTTVRIAAYTVGALAIIIGVLEVFVALLALGLCCCITSAKKQTVV